MTIAPHRPLALTKKFRTNVQRRLTMNSFVSLPKNENGMAHVLLAVLVIIVLGAIGAVAWKVNDNRSTSSTSINKEVQDKCTTAVNDEQFCKFAKKRERYGSRPISGTSNNCSRCDWGSCLESE